MAGTAVTLHINRKTAKGKAYAYRVLRWYDPKTGKRLSQTLGRADDRRHPDYITVRDAKKLRDLKAAEFDQHPMRRRRGLTIGQLVKWYLKKRRDEGTHPKTIRNDDQVGRMLIAFFGEDTRIADIRRATIENDLPSARDFWAAVRDDEGKLAAQVSKSQHKTQRWSQASARRCLTHCRAMMNAAVDDELIDAHPFARLGVGTPQAKTSWRETTRKEIRQLIEVVPSAGWQRALWLARWGALTRGDIVDLTWPSIDLAAREIRIERNKTGARQVAPIDDELLEELYKWHDQRAAIRLAGDLVVDPDSYSFENPGRDLAVWLRWAGVDPYGAPLHALRQSRISEWARKNAPQVVKLWAGHTNIQTTLNFYTRVSDADMEAGKGKASPLFTIAR